MVERFHFPYTSQVNAQGEIAWRPLLPISLHRDGQSHDAWGLVDSGADVNVLPYQLGLSLGSRWEDHDREIRLSGNLGNYEARGIVLEASIGPTPPVRLAFAWTRSEKAPLILGQANFFMTYEVCFFRSRNFFEVVAST